MNTDIVENENLIEEPEEMEPELEETEPESEEMEPELEETEPESVETETETFVYQSETQTVDYSEHFVILENLGYIQIVFIGTFLIYFVLSLVIKFIKSFF